MKPFLLITTSFLLSFISFSGQAHHGINGQFDASKNVTLTGVITNIRFVNPHSYVYFNVTSEDDSVAEGRCELPPGSAMRRNGWSTDMFKIGESLTIEGLPARREAFGCLAETLTFENGSVLGKEEVLNSAELTAIVTPAAKLADGTPNISGNWVAERRERQAAGAAMGQGMGEAMGQAMAGAMAMGGARGPSYAQTELGLSAAEGFNREQNPRFHCQATNIFLDWNFNEQVNFIEQSTDKIVMTYGFMDIVRTIHLDLDSHPVNITPSRAGHSIGKWQDGVLIVDTIGFMPGYLAATFNGVMHGEKLHTVERFSLSEDGKNLTREYTITDPEYLTAPYKGSDSVNLTASPFEPYNCEDLTEEIVEGF